MRDALPLTRGYRRIFSPVYFLDPLWCRKTPSPARRVTSGKSCSASVVDITYRASSVDGSVLLLIF